jgi:hypothetical protein
MFSAYSVGYDAGRSDERTGNRRREIVHQILTGARPVTVDQSYIDQLQVPSRRWLELGWRSLRVA